MTNTLSACTSILIGKQASIDGSIMIGRNEDAKAAWPKHMVVHQRGELGKRFISKETKLELVLPGESARYTATPEWTDRIRRGNERNRERLLKPAGFGL